MHVYAMRAVNKYIFETFMFWVNNYSNSFLNAAIYTTL